MSQFRLSIVQQKKNYQQIQNILVLKQSTRQNISPNKINTNNKQIFKDREFFYEQIENYKKINKQQNQTIKKHIQQIHKLKLLNQQNKQYTTLLQEKYTILLSSIQPFDQTVSIEYLLKKIIELQNKVKNLIQEKQLRDKTQNSSNFIINEIENLDQLSKSPILSKGISLKVQNNCTSSNNIQDDLHFNKSQTYLKQKKANFNSNLTVVNQKEFQSQIGIQVQIQENNQIRKRKKTIQNLIKPQLQSKNDINQNLSRKRKNSQFQETQSVQWQKIINQFLLNQQEKNIKFRDKTQYLLKKGIPYELRGTVWPMIFENNLGINLNFYMELLQMREKGWIQNSVKIQIHKDLNRSFNGKGQQILNKDKLVQQVRQVLQIFHICRPDVSYVQGMTYPAIVLITVVGKMKAFSILSNLIITIPFFQRIYSFEGNYLTIYCRTFDILLKQTNSSVYECLKKKKLNSELYLIQWFYTFFSRGMSFETILKIWDHLAYYGEVVFFKIGLTILELVSYYFNQASYEDTISLIKEFSSYLDEKKLIELFIQNKITPERFKRAYKKAIKQINSQNLN